MGLVVQTVELLLDEASEALIREQWAVLAAAGLPSQALHNGPANRPHITLTAQPGIAQDRERGLRDLFGGLPLPVRLGALTCFGRDRYVLVRALVATTDLLELQRHVFNVAGGGDGVRDLMRPGRWMPHVTLAHRMSAEQVGRALSVLHGSDETDGYAASARRWDGDARREWHLTSTD
jgi:2'-5' RNA ligase